MEIRTERVRNDIARVSVAGELDLYNAPQLKEEAVRLFGKQEPRIIVDLSDLRYVDSSGVGVLLYIYTGARKRGLDVVFSGVHGAVATVISLTKLDDFLPISESAEAAADRLGAREEVDRDTIKALRVDPDNPLFDTRGMYHKTFYIDLSQVRRLSNLIAQKAPRHLQEINILEQQISEIIKNAVRHGNGNDKSKRVEIWFRFTDKDARLIVEDEGEGFQALEEWNEFYRRKIESYRKSDFETMMNYLSFRTDQSTDTDGGNAMFAAIEYWDGGIVYNEKRNSVAVRKIFRGLRTPSG
jgi:anti-anti-sigma factor